MQCLQCRSSVPVPGDLSPRDDRKCCAYSGADTAAHAHVRCQLDPRRSSPHPISRIIFSRCCDLRRVHYVLLYGVHFALRVRQGDRPIHGFQVRERETPQLVLQIRRILPSGEFACGNRIRAFPFLPPSAMHGRRFSRRMWSARLPSMRPPCTCRSRWPSSAGRRCAGRTANGFVPLLPGSNSPVFTLEH